MIKSATFTSVWDGGYEVTTDCKVNMETHEIFEHLDNEYITLDGVDYAALNANEEDDIDKSDFWYEG